VQNQHLPSQSWLQLATRHVNGWSLSLTNMEQKPKLTVLLGHPNVSQMLAAIKHIATEIILFYRKTAHDCIVYATQSNCCHKKTLDFIVPELRPKQFSAEPH